MVGICVAANTLFRGMFRPSLPTMQLPTVWECFTLYVEIIFVHTVACRSCDWKNSVFNCPVHRMTNDVRVFYCTRNVWFVAPWGKFCSDVRDFCGIFDTTLSVFSQYLHNMSHIVKPSFSVSCGLPQWTFPPCMVDIVYIPSTRAAKWKVSNKDVWIYYFVHWNVFKIEKIIVFNFRFPCASSVFFVPDTGYISMFIFCQHYLLTHIIIRHFFCIVPTSEFCGWKCVTHSIHVGMCILSIQQVAF